MPKRTPIVCQHLENISRAALEKYQDIIREHIRGRHGVYALYRRGKLYYVGLASNLRRRLKQHLHDRHAGSWDRFSVYLTIGDRSMKELESLLLRIVNPPGNATGGRLYKSENLRQKFAHEIRRRQREDLDSLIGARRNKVKKPRAKPQKTATTGRQPIMARYIKKPVRLRARFKGKLYRATIRRDGTIRFNGEIYNSPSKAAGAACKKTSRNGWQFWSYERAPGDWVPLSQLKK